MGDQLIAVDQLLLNILLFEDNRTARCRINPLTILRSVPPQKKMLEQGNWMTEVWEKMAELSRKHIKAEKEEPYINGIPRRLEPPNELRGNFHVWKIVHLLWEEVKRDKYRHSEKTDRYLTRIVSSIDSSMYRTGVEYSATTRMKNYDKVLENSSLITQLTYLEATLWEIHAIRSNELNHMAKEKNAYGDPEVTEFLHKDLPSKYQCGIDMVVIGPLVVMKIGNYECIITKVHFERVCKILRTFLLHLLSHDALELKVSAEDFISGFLDSAWSIIEDDVDFLGECMKAARAIIITRLDTESIPGQSLTQGYLKTLNPRRRGYARYLASIIQDSCMTKVGAINLTNFFKAFPHPDANMSEVFDSIQAVREPNKVDPALVPRFEGVLRRAVFASLSAQGYDVRIKSLSPASDPIQDATWETRRRDASLRNFKAQTWATTRFHDIRHFINIDEIEIAASSKASQNRPNFTKEDLEESTTFMAEDGEHRPEFLREAHTVNDATSDLLGESELSAPQAIRLFERIVRAHEKFEASHPEFDKDEIPPEMLAEFIEEHPEAAYLVGTEPKFGEIHKKVTRMFYMAQQSLKSITQRVDRYAKQVCRRQPGVSITKSYPARRRDLENFCHSMTGNCGDKKAVFVSFDMSEFSKKFPMALVRSFGQVLSELSGRDWLKRIDIVFRASIVIHNSRGYFAKLSGVKGGFEGFFNFVWSSIHATIMEIALEATGLQGEILVFSDDGILMFHAPSNWSNEAIYKRVEAIQKIYARFGLHFNLGKSMVSYDVWEYLGDVCYNRKLIPMWFKEICSISRNVKNKGLEPFYSKVKALQAQCDSAIMSGAPAVACYRLKRYLFGCLIDRLGVTYSPVLEELLAIVPSSCGGLRITSPFEASFMGTIEHDAEFIADLVLLQKIDPKLSSCIMAGIRQDLRSHSDLAQAVISGTRFITNHPDVSGMRCMNDCIDKILECGRAVKQPAKNPLNGPFKDELEKVLLCLGDINLKAITDFIYSTPAWVEYTNSFALIRSSGVLGLVDRRTIMNLQRDDTRRVHASIDMWKDHLDYNYDGAVGKNYSGFIQAAEGKIFRGINLAKLRPSPRTVFTKDSPIGGIQVRFSNIDTTPLSMMEYIEPSIRMSKDESTLAWTSEAGITSASRNARKFMNSVARILSQSPESEHAIAAIARLTGVELPQLPPALVRGPHRKGTHRGKSIDAKIFAPRWIMSKTESRYFGDIGNVLYEIDHVDRTTYLEAARVLYSFEDALVNVGKYRRAQEVVIRNFYIPDGLVAAMHVNRPMIELRRYTPAHPVKELHKEMIQEFSNSYIEYSNSLDKEEVMADTAYIMGNATEADLAMVREVYIQTVRNWLVSAKRYHNATLLTTLELPLPKIETYTIFVSAIVEAALSSMDPRLRRSLLDQLNRWAMEVKKKTGEFVFALPDDMLSDNPFMSFSAEVGDMVDLAVAALPEDYQVNDISELRSNSSEVLRRLLTYAANMNIVTNPGIKGKITVIRSSKHLPTKMSPSHRQAFREAYTATLSAIVTTCEESKWDKEMVASTLSLSADVDEMLTMLHLGRAILRESTHRDTLHPYNPISFKIELYKFYYVLNRILREDLRRGKGGYYEENSERAEYDRAEVEEHMRTWVLGPIERDQARLTFNIKDHKKDHLEMLGKPILNEVHGRMWDYIRAAAKGEYYQGQAENLYYFHHYEMNGMQTTFFNVIVVPAAASIVEYSSELEHKILDLFNPSTPATIELLNLQTFYDELCGDYIDLEEVDEVTRTDLMKLASVHIRDLAIRAYVVGFKTANPRDLATAHCIAECYAAEGPSISFASYPDRADFYIYMMEYQDHLRALSDYTLLSKRSRSSVSLIHTNSKYILVGVSDINMNHMEAEFMDYPPIHGAHIDDLRRLIPNITLGGQSRAVAAFTQALTTTSQSDELIFKKVKTILTQSRRVDRSKNVVEDSHMLIAAFNVITESFQNNVIFGAYVGVILWLYDIDDAREIQAIEQAIRMRLRNGTDDARQRILADISLTTTWLAQCNIVAGLDTDDALIRDMMVSLRGVQLPFRVPVTASMAILKKPHEVKYDLGRPAGILGNVSSHLYKVEIIPMIEDVAPELTEEEQSRVDAWANLL